MSAGLVIRSAPNFIGPSAEWLGYEKIRASGNRDSFARYRCAVAKLAHQCLGSVGERLQTRQAKKAASAFDGVDEAEDIIEDLLVVWILLETHELDVDHVETFIGLGDKFPQQVVHKKRLRRRALARPPLPIGSAVSVSMKRLILVARRC